MRCSETVASLLVLLAGVVFSFGPLIFRSTSGEASAWQYMFWRFIGLGAVAGAGLIAMGVLLCRRPQPRWRDAGGGLMMCGCNVCFIVALDRVDAATVLLLQSLAPWSAALLGWALLREPVDKHTCLTMVLATAGVAIMGTDWGTADAVGLGAAITIAVLLGSYAVVIRASDARAGGYMARQRCQLMRWAPETQRQWLRAPQQGQSVCLMSHHPMAAWPWQWKAPCCSRCGLRCSALSSPPSPAASPSRIPCALRRRMLC